MIPDAAEAEVGVSILATLVGLLAGAVLGFNGFAQPATLSLVGQSPRIKNLIWLLFGFLPILLADAHKIGLPDKTSMAWPSFTYEVSAVLGALGAIGWIALSLGSSCHRFNHTVEAVYRLDVDKYLREYLTYGRARAEALFETDSNVARERVAADQARRADEERRRNAELEAESRRRMIEAQADIVAANCVYGVMKFVTLPKRQRNLAAERITGDIINTIVSQIRAMTGLDLKLAGSFMAYVDDQGAPAALKQEALFTTSPPAPARGYLDLRHGGGVATQRVVLPVAKLEGQVLPGAPMAVAALGAVTMNLSQIEFQPGVPEDIRALINDYFRKPLFKGVASITSIAVQDGAAIRGVLNIESSARDLLGQDEIATQSVIARLQTLVALLSIVPS
jgi:hypothetical protein